MGVTNAGSRLLRLAIAAFALAPFAFAGTAHAASYAKGLDVSNYQGTVDWLQVADAGYTFAFAKASESTGFTDVTYPLNRSGTSAMGMRMGGYHFARPGGSGDAALAVSAIAQADHFVDVAQPRGGDLPPVLDLEVTGGLTPTALAKWTQWWLGEVQARTGVRPLIYTSPNFWKTRLGDTTGFAEAQYGLWVAHWTKAAAPTVPAGGWDGRGWSFWQWTNCQSVPGITKCVDGDRASSANAASLALPAFPGGAPTSASAPTIVGTPRAGTRLAAVPGQWSGGKPIAFTYQWQSCDAAGGSCTPIVGATLPSYVPVAANVGHALSVTVSAAGSRGVATAVSPSTVAVGASGTAAGRPAAIAVPQVTGATTAGATLSGAVGTWSGSPSSFAYQWRRCDGFGAACVAIPGATTSSYILGPGDIGGTISLAVTATGAGGSQTATAATTGVVTAAAVPPAVVGSLAAAPGAAGAVATSDSRATVTWQPGAVPAGTTVGLGAATAPPSIAGTAVSLTLQPAVTTLPWSVDVAYASAPGKVVVGFSADGRTWKAVPALTGNALSGALLQGTYTDGGTLHVLTRQAGRLALFRAGRWGDPSQVSPRAPVLRRLTQPVLERQSDGTLLLRTRLSTSSQAHVNATIVATGGVRPWILKRGSRLAAPLGSGSTRKAQALVLRSGGFPVTFRLSTRGLASRSLVRIHFQAIDPWGRQGGLTLSFRVP